MFLAGFLSALTDSAIIISLIVSVLRDPILLVARHLDPSTFLVFDGSPVRLPGFLYRSRLKLDSALGTPLAWPEAKTKADQVRSWGIEVSAVFDMFFASC